MMVSGSRPGYDSPRGRPRSGSATASGGRDGRTMPWIPHLMVLDDDPRVLDSLVPSFAHELGRGLAKSKGLGEALRRGKPGGIAPNAPINIKVSVHGFESDRLKAYR